MDWGLLGGEALGSTRRVRPLGLGAAVQGFNELAVPGLGGVWYAKQLVLALLGVDLAERARAGAVGPSGRKLSNIAVADAVEALACRIGFETSKWARDLRLRGLRKFQRGDAGRLPGFAEASRRGFYVSQPMRVGTRDPLLELGLVKAGARRFNGFACTESGRRLLEAAFPKASQGLEAWMRGKSPAKTVRTELDPTRSLPAPARELLFDALANHGNGAPRRSAALRWTKALRVGSMASPDWEACPPEIDPEHWHDMRLGALFFGVRAAALALLDRIEAELSRLGEPRLTLTQAMHLAQSECEALDARARAFLAEPRDPSPDGAAGTFCHDVLMEEPVEALARLLRREGRVLRFDDRHVVPGAAFQGRSTDATAEKEEDDLEPEDGAAVVVGGLPDLPAGISHRVANLFWLDADLRDDLGARLAAA